MNWHQVCQNNMRYHIEDAIYSFMSVNCDQITISMKSEKLGLRPRVTLPYYLANVVRLKCIL